MSELSLTLLRLGFLLVLWTTVIVILWTLRQDLNLAERRTSRRRTPAVTVAPNRASGKLGRVICTNPDGANSEVPLADGLVIGRDTDCQIVLQDDYASSRHAEIHRTAAGWIYRDLGSTNGSWVNSKRLEAELLIKPGTTIRIGKSYLRFEK